MVVTCPRADGPLGVVTLPGTARAVDAARRFVRDILGAGHLAYEDAVLSVSELFTNAIEHTLSGVGGWVTVGVLAGPGVICLHVTNDGNAGKPCVRDDPDAEDGRGLLIVDTLASRWGVTEQDDATTVWAEFRR